MTGWTLTCLPHGSYWFVEDEKGRVVGDGNTVIDAMLHAMSHLLSMDEGEEGD